MPSLLPKNILKLSPLTEATFYILISLTNPLHGYGIIKKVESLSNGSIILAAGTLYGALTNLQKHELILPVGDDPENSRRKIYEITPLGLLLIEHELERLELMLINGKKMNRRSSHEGKRSEQ